MCLWCIRRCSRIDLMLVLEDSTCALKFQSSPHSRRSTLAARAARREEEREQRKREALRKITPGFEPRLEHLSYLRSNLPWIADRRPHVGHARTRSVMDGLIDQLAAITTITDLCYEVTDRRPSIVMLQGSSCPSPAQYVTRTTTSDQTRSWRPCSRR